MEWNKIPKELKILSFKDFCIRRDEVYKAFWGAFAPFFDIAIYRDYLLEEVPFAKHPIKQENMAGRVWEYLMGDINDEDLIFIWSSMRRGDGGYERNHESDDTNI